MGHVPRVNQALMEIIVITHVPATVKATHVTFNMERVFSASLDGQGLYVAQVRFFSYVKIRNKSPRYLIWAIKAINLVKSAFQNEI